MNEKDAILRDLTEQYGQVTKFKNSLSMYHIDSVDTIVYFRYSKLSRRRPDRLKAFYGLRKADLDAMRGKKAFICFLTDDREVSIVIPFGKFEHHFSGKEPSGDGQYKVLAYFNPQGSELYFANILRKFKSDSYLGLSALYNIEKSGIRVPELSHSQVQSLVGSIGMTKGFNIWFPKNDLLKIDKRIINSSRIREDLPQYREGIENIISEIDVIWFKGAAPVAFYEVEHSTPIYSGLLRFNDVLLSVDGADNFNVIASSDRESKFDREISRPTFRQNKLNERVSFLDYSNVYHWYYNLTGELYK